jgi:hypothetical protein
MACAALAAVALAAAFAYGGEAALGDPELALVGMFSSPTYLTAPPGDADRLFVVEQAGLIRVVCNGVTLRTAFLGLTSFVLSGGERGLLSMAFAPDKRSIRARGRVLTQAPRPSARRVRGTRVSFTVSRGRR